MLTVCSGDGGSISSASIRSLLKMTECILHYPSRNSRGSLLLVFWRPVWWGSLCRFFNAVMHPAVSWILLPLGMLSCPFVKEHVFHSSFKGLFFGLCKGCRYNCSHSCETRNKFCQKQKKKKKKAFLYNVRLWNKLHLDAHTVLKKLVTVISNTGFSSACLLLFFFFFWYWL